MIRPAHGDPKVVAVMRGFKAALLEREREQMRKMARRWLGVEEALEGSIEALAREAGEMRREGAIVAEWKIFELDRYRKLIAQVWRELRQYSAYAGEMITAEQHRAAGLGIRHAAAALRAQGVRAGFAVLPVEAVEFMAGLAGDGSPLLDVLVKSWPDAAAGLTDALVRSTALGWNPRKTAREMRRGVTRGLGRMLTIARTEQLRVYREATRQQYIRSGVVTGYRRLAARNDRTCPACLMADGEVYDLNEPLREHPSGRCTLVPLVAGFAPVQWKLGRDWFTAQDPATQRRILGKGRFQAWQDGRFDLDELVQVRRDATWGDSLQVAPLRDLGG